MTKAGALHVQGELKSAISVNHETVRGRNNKQQDAITVKSPQEIRKQYQ